MRPLNAIDAISPAIARTKLVMFTPFRFGRTWKIGISSYLTILGSVFVPWPLFYVMFFFGFVPKGSLGGAAIISVLLIAVTVLTLLYLLVFYLLSRLRFALFGMVLNNEPLVTPMWRSYGRFALPWTLLKLVLGSVLIAFVSVPLFHAVRSFVPLMAAMQVQPGQPPNPRFFMVLMKFYAAFFGLYALFGLYMWLSALLSDFIVPSLALEGVSLREAFQRIFLLIRNETGTFLGYAFMKPILAIAGGMCAGIAFYFVLFVEVLVAVLMGLLAGFLLHLVHVPNTVLIVLAVVCGGTLYLASTLYLMGIAMGALNVFLEAYLQFFLGGRYPMLGELLERSTLSEPVMQPLYAAYPPPPTA